MPRTYSRKKQTRLVFAPIVSSSPDIEPNPGDEADRRAKLRYDHPSKPTIRQKRSRVDNQSARQDRHHGDASKRIKLSNDHSESFQDSKGISRIVLSDDEDKTRNKSSRGESNQSQISTPQPPSKSTTNGGVSSDEDIVLPSARRRQKEKTIVVSSESESDSERSHSSEMKVKMKPPDKKESQKSSKVNRTTTRKTRSATQAAEPALSSAGPAERTKSSALLQSDLGSPETSDADEIVTKPRKLRRGAAPKRALPVDDSDASQEEPVNPTPAKRRKLYSSSELPQTPRATSAQDRLDLEEDLEDLQDSVVKETRTRGRLADSAKTQRQKHLEILRRRRAGEKARSGTDSEPESEVEEPEADDDQSDANGPTETITNLEPPEDSDVESPVSDNEDLDRYEDDFVLEDDGDELGVPTGLEEMPFQFTRHNYKQAKEYFADAVEWMVHNKLNPAFPRSDPLYKTAFSKLDDEVKGRAGSQLVSSTWNIDFRRALMARPHFDVTLFPITDGHPCDACNRSGHPASSDIKLYGKAYSLETLEPLSEENGDGDEESSEETDAGERDRDGHILPDESRRWFLGRHCKSKAELAHTLVHWRFHLNEWVIDYLERQGVLADEQILERNHMSQKRKTKYACSVVKMMADTGEVKRLWRDFHINLKAARETTESRW